MNDERVTNPGLRNALQLLNACAGSSHDGRGFSDLRAAAGGLTSATASRLLAVLQEEGWIERGTDGRYRLATAAYQFASQLTQHSSHDSAIQWAVNELAAQCGHSAAYTVWDEDGFRFRYKQEVSGSYPYLAIGQIGLNVFQNGFGQMNLAHQSNETIQRLCQQHDRRFDVIQRVFGEIRETTLWQCEDIGLRFLAPIYAGNHYLGTLGVSCPLGTLSAGETQALKETMAVILQQLKEQFYESD